MKEESRRLNLSGQREILLIKSIIILAILSLLITSCASPVGTEEQVETVTNTAVYTPSINPVSKTQRQYENTTPYPPLPQGIERVEVTQSPPATGEVPPDLMKSVLEHLSNHLNIDPQEIEILKSEAILWPDGSLGCPKPDEFYTQALVNGYWLILQVEGTKYDYRAAGSGYFFLCEQPLLQNPPHQEDK